MVTTEAVRALKLGEALAALAEQKFMILAGGTDLMVRNRSWAGTLPRFAYPPLFIAEIPELRKVEQRGDVLLIGAAARLTDLIEDEKVPEILKSAFRNMASPAIRNIATIGGNVCNASPAGDSLPALYVLGATVSLKSAHGERKLAIEDFIKGPGKTDLHPDELLTCVRLPCGRFNNIFYKKLGPRKANAISKLSVAALARTEDGVIRDIRIAVGAAAPTVVRLKEIERSLIGKSIGELAKYSDAVSALYADAIRPIDDQRSTAAYRKTVALGLIGRFIENLEQQ